MKALRHNKFRSLSILKYALLVFGAVLLLNSCGGGSCSRKKDVGTQPLPPSRDNADEILAHPVVFDEQSVAEAEHLVLNTNKLTTAETAQIIVVTEAALNHLSQIIEQLQRNDDDADTFHVLSELNSKEWPWQCSRIVTALDARDLDSYERQRVESMVKTANYIHDITEKLYPTLEAFDSESHL